ncbi:MAG: hypothetical protein HUU49_02965 [Candidatus Buchananbacteria bacterium]|nr:hypothetical protein [Candidatus Buchananbacteria bacterium]
MAQDGGIKPTLSVKIGNTTLEFDPVSCEGGTQCAIPWIGKYITAIYNYGVAVAGVLAVIMIMVGGFLWLVSAGNPNQISTAKDFITSALTGLLLALFSFIILQTVNPKLVELDDLSVSVGDEFDPALVRDYGGGAVDTGGEYTGALPTGTSQGETTTRASLDEHDIGINKAPCQYAGQTNCTNVGGLEGTTVDSLNSLADEYGGFTITGATEAGHHTSRPGYQADIRIGENAELDGYIQSHESITVQWGKDPSATMYRNVTLPNGRTATFVDESPVGGTRHWHVEFY